MTTRSTTRSFVRRRSALTRSVGYAVDRLEQRTLLSSISGVVWQDRNADGLRDGSEPGLSGRTVYVDANDNGNFDAGERSSTTATGGAYTLGGLPAGTYALRQVTPADAVWTTASTVHRSIATGENATGGDFGSRKLIIAATQKFYASDAASGEQFGETGMSSDGSTLVVGNFRDSDAGAGSGSAYVFTRDLDGNWVQAQKLTASDAAAADAFGGAVALLGDTLFVSAYGDDNASGADAGAVYLFKKNTGGIWVQSGKLLPSDLAAGDRFGSMLVAAGDELIVGSPSDDDAATDTGSAYVFKRNAQGDWLQTTKLNDPAASANDLFAEVSMSLQNDTLVIGSSQPGRPGVVNAFVRNGSGSWVWSQRMSAPDAVNGSQFSSGAIALNGNKLAVGAQGNGGAVYVYKRSSASSAWVFDQKLFASDPQSGASFGHALAWQDRMLVVSALTQANERGPVAGAFYVFAETSEGSLVAQGKQLANDGELDDRLGASLITVGSTLLISAVGDDDRAINEGAIYSYDIAPASYLSGVTWNDRNGDGIQDALEPVVAGRTVYLDRDDDGIIDANEPSLVTNTTGGYEFADVIPGTYRVRQVLPAGWLGTTSTSAPAGRVTVGPGQNMTAAPLGSAGLVTGTQTKVFPPAGKANDDLGAYSMSESGGTLAVGAASSNSGIVNDGVVFLFTRASDGTWTPSARITADDAAVGDRLFGARVAIVGDTLFVTAPHDDSAGTNAGAVYLFKRNAGGTWSQASKIVPGDIAPHDHFGGSLAFEGDTLMVGAGFDDDRGDASGSVYVFERDSAGDWNQTQKLTASDGAAGDAFGDQRLALQGNTLVVGAHADDDRGTNSGSVYVFRRDTSGLWQQGQKLTAPDGAGGHQFGISVALEGNRIAVGANGAGFFGGDSGAAYVFDLNASGTWVYSARITAFDATFGTNFGTSVSLVGNRLAITSPNDDRLSFDTGAVYLYTSDGRGGWSNAGKLSPTDVETNKHYGQTALLASDQLLVGAPGNTTNGANSGAVYSYGYAAGAYVSGTLYSDLNKNGQRDGGEGTLAGWTIYLDTNRSGFKEAGEPTTVSDTKGDYNFDDLTPGDYAVRIVQQDEWSQTSPASGYGHIMRLSSGETRASRDFGIVNAATVVGGIVWNDRNADGVRQPDLEPLLSGRTVYWDINSNGTRDDGEPLSVTDASGIWTLRNVLPGDRIFGQVPYVNWLPVGTAGTGVSQHVFASAGELTDQIRFGQTRALFRQQRVVPTDPLAGDEFGNTVAMSGDYAAVGSMTRGRVVIYKRQADDTWIEQTTFRPFGGDPAYLFGRNIEMDGTTLVVSSDGSGPSGALYVYELTQGTWSFKTRLEGPDPQHYIGTSLAVEGDTIAVGAPGTSSGRGSVEIYRRNSSGVWAWSTRALAIGQAPGESMALNGRIDLSGDQLIAGSYYHAYIFQRAANGSYSQAADLLSPDLLSAEFGASARISGNTAVLASGPNAVAVYARGSGGTWSLIQTLTPQQGDANFHADVDLNGTELWIGSPGATPGGAIYHYSQGPNGRFDLRERLATPGGDADGYDFYGGSIAADGRFAVVGAPTDDALGANSGAAYFISSDTRLPSYLRGTAFQDIDNDAIHDVAEPGNANWTVYLDTNDNGLVDPGEPTQITDASGFYEFADLAPGNYIVRQQPQALWTQTKPSSNQPYRVTLTPGQTFVGDFGLYASASVTGIVFADVNGNGINDGADTALVGWVVFADLDGNRALDNGEPTAITAADGSYQLSDLPIRSLKIDVVDGASWGITPRTAPLTTSLVISGQNFGSQAAAGVTFPTSGALVGRVAVDSDDSGEVDLFENLNVAGVGFTVYRDDGDGVFEPLLNDTLAGSTTSSANGLISVPGLAIGTYWLKLDENSSGMAGYSLFGRSAVRRGVVSAQKSNGTINFAVLQAYTVNTLLDEIPGSNTPAHLSLREALDFVRTDGKDTSAVLFDPSLAGGTIELDANVGQLLVFDGVSIIGPTPAPITIRSGGTGRVMSISSGVAASMQDLVLTGGSAATGGAITVGFGASLAAQRLVLRDNAASQRGGAIYVSSGATVSLRDSVLNDNTAGIQGGAMYVASEANVALGDVTAYGNAATGAAGDGGAIYNLGSIVAVGLTLSANAAARSGGGVAVSGGSLNLTNATVVRNVAGTGAGGGIAVTGGGSATIANTLVAANRHGAVADDISGALDSASHHSLVAAGASGIVNAINGNFAGTTVAPLDAKFMPLANYGGRVPTHALYHDSLAIEAGQNVAGTLSDAAGNPRTRDYDNNGTATIDIGAFEAAPIITVDSVLDEATDTDSKTSLREALALSATRPGFDTIRFSGALSTGGEIVVPVSLGELELAGNVYVEGRSDGRVVIDALGGSRVLHVLAGGSAIISDLTIRGGNASTGGGIRNDATLVLERALLADNSATADGGAIWSTGALSVANTTFSGNRASSRGAGMFVAGGTAKVLNSTISDNLVTAGSSATGAGIFAAAGGVTRVTNTIIAGNRRSTVPGGTAVADDVAGNFDAGGFNFVGAIDSSIGLNAAGSQFGTAAAPADPRLTTLGDHGGPTLTHGLLPASPVTDAGSDGESASLATDARGQARIKDGNDDGIARVDIGAVEQQFPLNQAPTLSAMSPIGGAVEGVPFTLAYDAMRLASNAADPEGEAIGFRIESVTAGSFTLNGIAIVAGQTVLMPGQSLVWTPPGGLNFGTASSVTVPAFTVRAFDGQVANVGAALAVNLTVRTVAQPINYALLFSGGDRVDLNYNIYYDNLKRMYGVLINQYGLRPEDIYVVYADGRSTAPDQKGGINSDMSFATSNVLPATRDNLRTTLQTIAGKADANDHFLFWTFDHGLGSTNRPSEAGEEIIKGWGGDQVISDKELRVWTQGLNATDNPATYNVPAGYGGVRSGFNTYHFAQCFSGGMLDDFTLGATSYGGVNYGMASSNHYEASYADYFAAPFVDALALGYNSTAAAYRYAFSNDSRAITASPNGGSWAFNVEHPWAGGVDFPIFATVRNQNAAPELRSVAPLRIAASATELTIDYDQLVAASDGTDPTGQALVFQVTGVSVGSLLRDGVPLNLGSATQSTIKFGESITWRRPVGSSGTLNALSVRLLAPDGTASPSRTVPIRIGSPVGLVAVDDVATVQSNTVATPLSLTVNDVGVNARLLRVGVPAHGKVAFDATTGQVRYTPATDHLGNDSFSYLVTDGVNTDLATVRISVVSFDPTQQQAGTGSFDATRYKLTELAPPPGWAALPTTWSWTYRQTVPGWMNTRGVDISDDGVVIVKVSRPNVAGNALDYVGSTNASYRWQSGDVNPYWNTNLDGSISASNAQLLLLETEFTNSGRAILNGIDAVSTGNPAVLPTLRYLDPDNANEVGFPAVGGIYYDVGDGSAGALWQALPEDVYPVAVNATPTNSAAYLGIANRRGVGIGSRAQLWSYSRDGSSQIGNDLNGRGGSHRSSATAISDTGHFVGWEEVQQDDYQAFYASSDGAVTRLYALPGFTESAATAVNGVGQVVGYSAANIGSTADARAFLWTASTGAMIALGTLGGSGWSVANDISSAGTIVGASNGRAFVWSGGSMYDLNALADNLPSGVTLTSADGINRNGQIVATGTGPGGVTRAYFVDLSASVATVNDSVPATNRAAISFNPLANDHGARSVRSVSTAGLKGTLTWNAQGNFSFDPADQFMDLAVGQSRATSFTYTADDGRGGTSTATVSISVAGTSALSTFHVASLVAAPSGFTLELSHPLDLSKLNLYDGQDASVDLPDVIVRNAANVPVQGSVVWQATTNTLRFVATGGVLDAGTYTVQLAGRTDGVVSTTLGALDGNADNIAGGDYVREFTISAAEAQKRRVTLPDLSRGPGQSFTLPITIDNGEGVRAIDFDLHFDPTLLTIDGASLGTALPQGWSLTINPAVSPGVARISLFSTTVLPAGSAELIRIAATVPAGATYRSTDLLSIESLKLNENAIPSRADDAIHKVAYVGDVTGNGGYSGLDASRIARLATTLDTGFDPYATTDPRIVADVTGNGTITALDASDVAQMAAGLAPASIPSLPAGIAPLIVGGPDPTVSLGSATVAPGAAASVEAAITDDARGLQAFDLTIHYDAARFDATAASVALGTLLSSLGSWSIVKNVDPIAGGIRVTAYSATPLAGASALTGSILALQLQAKATAATGSSSLHVAVDAPSLLNEGELAMTAIDGTLLVASTVAPLLVTSSSFNWNASRQTIVVSFDQPVLQSTLDVSDVALFDLATGLPVQIAKTLSYDAATRQLSIVFGTTALPVTLGDGRYQLRLAAGSVAAVGTGAGGIGGGLLAAHTLDFFTLAGDANHDGRVNFSDLVILAQNYNGVGRSFSAGNFNYDAAGAVNFADLVILAQNYNKVLPVALNAAVEPLAAFSVPIVRPSLVELEQQVAGLEAPVPAAPAATVPRKAAPSKGGAKAAADRP